LAVIRKYWQKMVKFFLKFIFREKNREKKSNSVPQKTIQYGNGRRIVGETKENVPNSGSVHPKSHFA